MMVTYMCVRKIGRGYLYLVQNSVKCLLGNSILTMSWLSDDASQESFPDFESPRRRSFPLWPMKLLLSTAAIHCCYNFPQTLTSRAPKPNLSASATSSQARKVTHPQVLLCKASPMERNTDEIAADCEPFHAALPPLLCMRFEHLACSPETSARSKHIGPKYDASRAPQVALGFQCQILERQRPLCGNTGPRDRMPKTHVTVKTRLPLEGPPLSPPLIRPSLIRTPYNPTSCLSFPPSRGYRNAPMQRNIPVAAAPLALKERVPWAALTPQILNAATQDLN